MSLERNKSSCQWHMYCDRLLQALKEGSFLLCVGRLVGYRRGWQLVECGAGEAGVHAPYSFEGKLQC